MSSTQPLKIETPRVFLPLLQPARYKGVYGGRGSGKSHDRAEALVERCLLNPGTRWACIREVQKSLAQSVKLLVEDKIRKFKAESAFQITQDKIITPGGGMLIFQGMQNHTADSIKSLEGFDGAWVEEAQTLSQRSLDLLRPTIRKQGSELWFTWNPEDPKAPVDSLLRGDDAPPNMILVRANYMDNPWFPDVLREEMEYDRSRDYDKYLHVWEGEYWLNSEARVFKNWRIEEFEAPDGAAFRFGADWGYANDPTVLVRGYVEGRKLYIDYESWMINCEIDQTPDLFDRVPMSRDFFITADSARPETISYMRRHGYPKINAAHKGKGSLEDGVEFLKSFEIIVHPRCQHVIDELTHYSWKTDPLTGDVLPYLEDKHNHTIDSIRYLLEGIRRASRAAPQNKPSPAPQSKPWRTGSTGWLAN